uniref:Carboxypeptidase n=1 Tax=Clastoptera arizonana TaxID=38151 RepID=A0A1B6E5I6_9HEMI
MKLLLCFVIACAVSSQAFFRPKKHSVPLEIGADPGEPLFLTPLLEQGKIEKAQKESKVKPDLAGLPSYSGYFTVNKNCGSNLFFWFFPSQNDWKTAPVLLWLQGGPGATSMYGLFEELGPYRSLKSGLKKRKYSWNVYNNLLFIDQPVGTGYSFTNNSGCYPTNETAVGVDLYSALTQFFTLFPDLQENNFFISGESYAGKYIPAIGHTIHQNNPSADIKINLQGMFIGDGWSDPLTQTNYGDYLYELGFIDTAQRKLYYQAQKKFEKEVKNGDYENASTTLDSLTEDLYTQCVGSEVSVYNYLPKKSEESTWDTFIQKAKTRKSIHVGATPFRWGDDTYKNLEIDIVMSVKPWVEELLEYYPMLFYNGEVDIICAYPMTVHFLRSLQWSGEEGYKNATRYKWKVGDDLAGYFKFSGNLMELMVRDAGHMVPADQPKWAFNMINMATGVFNHSLMDIVYSSENENDV